MGCYRIAYNKYGNIKCECDGHKFDSRKEMRRYQELKLLEKAGVISGLMLQPKFELLPTLRKNGKTFQRRFYIADFSYYDNEKKKRIVEDTKGVKTKEYKLKRHMFEAKYPDLWIEEL